MNSIPVRRTRFLRKRVSLCGFRIQSYLHTSKKKKNFCGNELNSCASNSISTQKSEPLWLPYLVIFTHFVTEPHLCRVNITCLSRLLPISLLETSWIPCTCKEKLTYKKAKCVFFQHKLYYFLKNRPKTQQAG